MNHVSRREVVRVVAAGAAVMAGAGVAAASDAVRPRTVKSRAGASGMAPPAAAGFERHTRTSPRMALVERCRSWDSSVYLTFEDSTRGWAAVSPAGLAIAAACQAAGRPVAALAWGHDGDWNAGQGRFEGVLLAVEIVDLSPTVERS